MQSKQEIEDSYKTPDPWGYQNSNEDNKRKDYLLGLIDVIGGEADHETAIDICCGEGWITQDLPALTIHGLELSDTAASRFPANVKRVLAPEKGFYDLVLSTGCLYPHYDWEQIVHYINKASKPGSLIVTSNIEAWEYANAVCKIEGREIFSARFPYNEHYQKVRMFLR